MSGEKQLAKIEEQEVPVLAMMKHLIDSGAMTADSAAAMEKLCGLYERLEDKRAERSYAADFVALKSEMKPIKASRPVKNNDGTLRYTFAPLEDLMNEIEPIALRHGFAITFGEGDAPEGKVKGVCIVTHVSGHKVITTFTVRATKGAPGCSEAQIDGGGMTYAKRFALCGAFGIIIEKDIDADARVLGEPITAEQAKELRERCADLDVNEGRFLAYAHAASFDDIMSGRYSDLDAWLRKTAAKK